MRGLLGIGMYLYIIFYPLYLLSFKWGWGVYLLLLSGPAVAILAPLGAWIYFGDYSYLALFFIGNLALFAAFLLPTMIDEKLPKNTVISHVRTLIISLFSIIFISQGIGMLGVFLSMVLETAVIDYLLASIGGIYAGYLFVRFHVNSKFSNLMTKKILYIYAIPLSLINIFGNMSIMDVYALNSLLCMISCIYFIHSSSLPFSSNKTNLNN